MRSINFIQAIEKYGLILTQQSLSLYYKKYFVQFYIFYTKSVIRVVRGFLFKSHWNERKLNRKNSLSEGLIYGRRWIVAGLSFPWILLPLLWYYQRLSKSSKRGKKRKGEKDKGKGEGKGRKGTEEGRKTNILYSRTRGHLLLPCSSRPICCWHSLLLNCEA